MSKFLRILAHLILWPTIILTIVASQNLEGWPFFDFPFYSTITGVIFILFVSIPLFLITYGLFWLAARKKGA